MKEYRPVNISNGAFNFCKFTIALSLWTALITQLRIIVLLCFIVLVLSAIIKVKNAPLVFLYSHTIDKIYPAKRVIVDESAVRFAHIVGAVFAAAALLFLYFINPIIGWIIIGVLAVLKTSGAFGFCGAMKLYGCLNNPNGQCCRVGSKVKKNYCNKQ